MRIAIYTRVSTDEQAQKGISLSLQLDACRRYALDRGHTIAKEYIDDGYSAGDTDRPGLKKLRQDAKDKLFDLIISWKGDRLSRDTVDSLLLVYREFLPLGIQFASVTESYDSTTPVGKMMFTMLAMQADHERTNIRLRSMLGRRRFMELGKCSLPKLPLGFSRGPNKEWLHNDEGKALYLRIVAWYVDDDYSITTIARKLTTYGIKPKQGSQWSKRSILNILKNPLYKGEGHYGDISYKVPPIIAEERWDQIQSAMRDHAKGVGPRPRNLWILKGIMQCGHCGRNIVSKAITTRGHSYYKYHCATNLHDWWKIDVKPCPLPQMDRDETDTIIWHRVSKRIKNPNFIKDLFTELKITDKMPKLEEELASLSKSILKKQGEKEKLILLYTEAKHIKTIDIDRHVQRVEGELGVLEKESKAIQRALNNKKAMRENVSQIEGEIEELRKRIDNLTPQEKRDVLSKMLKSPILVKYNEKRSRHAFFSQTEPTQEVKRLIMDFINQTGISIQI